MKKRKRGAKAVARTTLRKALAEWSRAVRDRDGKRCSVCGRTDYLNAHHLIPKERFPMYRLEVDNGISLCPSCHKFGSFSAHRHPLWFAEWLRANRPDLYSAAVKRLDLSAP